MYIKRAPPRRLQSAPAFETSHITMLHYMHPQEKASTAQRSPPSSAAPRAAVSAGRTVRQQTSAPAPAAVRQQTSAPAPAAVRQQTSAPTDREFNELCSEYHKQDKIIHELSLQNEANKERASKYKQTLKTRVEDMKALQAKADKYKAQVKALESAQAANGDGKKGSISKLAATAKELSEANKELEALKSELPQVKALLTKGGQAIQKLEVETKRNQELQQQLAQLRSSKPPTTSAAADSLLLLHGAGSGADSALKTKNQQLQSEVVAVKDKLKAASQEVSARVSQVAACKDMLAKAEAVLQTCSELHESKGGDALASALRETTDNVQAFLQNLSSGSPKKPHS